MAWEWVWIGAALILGAFMGMSLMSLLIIAHNESRNGVAPEQCGGGEQVWPC